MIFDKTHYIAIELSNLCNYSDRHKKCPANSVTDKKILPSWAVYKILDELSECGYDKAIAFYLYSDSLNDPRLFKYLSYAKDKCPKACNIVGTNGWYLDLVMARELYENGADYISVSAYNEKDFEYFKQIKRFLKAYSRKPIAFGIKRVESLDERTNMEGNINGKCFAPLTEIVIRADGSIPLCCLDIDCKESYGNIMDGKLSDTVKNERARLERLRNELSEGKRTLELCKNCSFCRWLSIKEHGRDIRFEKDIANKS
jgi:radical SAM protein with 4Fe4S-binding SPASM domain